MLIRIAIAALAGALLTTGAALARDYDRYDDDLSGYDIVIGDTGDRYDGWDDDEMRTYVRVEDSRGRRHDGYFDSIASAFFVLKEQYGTVRVLDIGVPDFGDKYGHHRASHYDDYGLIDGDRAWYFWDDDRRARGGLPLIYSFFDRRDAYDFGRYRDGEVMDFDEVVYQLKRWHDDYRDRVYWRGWDTNRWDNRHWSSAWNRRWHGYGWDRDNGWTLKLNVDRDGDVNVGGIRYRNNGVGVVINNDRHDSGNHNRGRGNGNGNSNGRGNGGRQYRGNDDRDNNGNDNKDNSGKYGREKKREKNR